MAQITAADINRQNRAYWDQRQAEAERLWQTGQGLWHCGGGPADDSAVSVDVPSNMPGQQPTGRSGSGGGRSLNDEAERRAYLIAHPVTKVVMQGCTLEEHHLRRIHLRPAHGLPFSLWPTRMSADVPRDAIPRVRPYAVLKWLILDDPPPSRDRDDAWRYVGEIMVAPDIELGMKTRLAQRARAKKPRGKTGDDQTIRNIVAGLALRNRDAAAKELWLHFWSELERHGLAPEEVVAPKDRAKVALEYEGERRRRRITFGRFATIVSRERRQESR